MKHLAENIKGFVLNRKVSWRSGYKLPASFIVFFVLFFFLVGEQLPALSLYIAGPSEHEDKVHILDLSPSDALHRPIAYLLIAALIWFLFRTFAWPIAWVIGAVFWMLEQLFLTPLDQRPSLSGVIFFTFTFWVILTLVPYFIYRGVDCKWGGRGRRNLILITLAINLLLLSFFAYQIFYLHNSYRGLLLNEGQGVPPGLGLPPNTCPDRLVTEKDKQTTAYWEGKIFPVSAAVQNWIEENCPGALENRAQP